ncbi:MAG: LamG domain-containing protein [Planctomycetota bacterium]
MIHRPNAIVFLFACLASLPFDAVHAEPTAESSRRGTLKAGAYAIDITPLEYPVIVNGMFNERIADRAVDPLHARCLVLDNGETKIAFVIVDSCIVPRDLIDRAKEMATKKTGIPSEHMLVSATHTHSAPSVIGALGSDVDPKYVEFLPGQIARGIEQAAKQLTPAKAGWGTIDAPGYTYCRRWILRPDKVRNDPFGVPNVRANMHPGYQNPEFLGPSGPVDMGLSMLAIQTVDGKPLAVLANYSMHYFGSQILSADYFGRFADGLMKRITPEPSNPPFVAMMSQGTSGDLMWMDYGMPQSGISLDAYSDAVAERAFQLYQTLNYQSDIPLGMMESKVTLRTRQPSVERLAWSEKVVHELNGKKPMTQPEIYAREQLILSKTPTRELKLQTIRVGDLGIVAIPNEVFSITGLKLKAQSPFATTFTIELANGGEGYIPPPEQHRLGGYTTWAARSAGLEEKAEPTIVEIQLRQLEQLAGKPRRNINANDFPLGSYPGTILAAKPAGYWRLNEFDISPVSDLTGNHGDGTYDGQVALYLDGPGNYRGPSPAESNRAPQFAGGRLELPVTCDRERYSIEFFFRNHLPSDARPITGYLCSLAKNGDSTLSGDHLGIGGTHDEIPKGRLFLFNGNDRHQILVGKTTLQPGQWHHLVMVRDGKRIAVYLDGKSEPEVEGYMEVTTPPTDSRLFLAGRCDNFANLEGRIDEVAVFDRPLSAAEIKRHYDAAR